VRGEHTIPIEADGKAYEFSAASADRGASRVSSRAFKAMWKKMVRKTGYEPRLFSDDYYQWEEHAGRVANWLAGHT
jgi:hypothetical protein